VSTLRGRLSWGENLHGQLGDGRRSHGHSIAWGNSTKYDFSPVPVEVHGISNATAISAGSSHTCAALTGGSVECLGDNVFGQLGDGKLGDTAAPVKVAGLR
jgi:alpha-tubulin suppressor-like RCC1 family protein